ncbi:helix-turn-helix domain protein [Gemmatirosa kalamazoonensis]|uniref:Helix-turn-helix domain protein n=1 Tax=Gemmatirosa kalamazoonensis TaxID=861299 RepID=W0RQN5_9BACT|nr:helix-turn-helix transcriptional regulator [Gemmatirosa kalamazoonensis]AHG91863.1 helix-turn-helix domain protein [Gemmatirosa kalamazoonensis]
MKTPKKVTPRGRTRARKAKPARRGHGRPKKNAPAQPGEQINYPAARADLAHRLGRLRVDMGYTQTAFAKACGVTPTNMGKYLAGTMQPGFDLLVRIAERCRGVSVDWLLFGPGDEPRYRALSPTYGTDEELAHGVAAYLAREVSAALIAEPLPHGMPPGSPRCVVNGAAALRDVAARQVDALRLRIEAERLADADWHSRAIAPPAPGQEPRWRARYVGGLPPLYVGLQFDMVDVTRGRRAPMTIQFPSRLDA